MKYPLTLSLCFFLAAYGLARAQAPVTYTYQQITPGAPAGINDRGQILALDTGGAPFNVYAPFLTYSIDQHAYEVSDITVGTDKVVSAFNNLDQFVAQDPSTGGFAIQNGVDGPITYGSFMGAGNGPDVPNAINDNETIVGLSYGTTGSQAAIFINGKGRLIPFPGAVVSGLNSINDSEVAVGSYMAQDGSRHGMIYASGRYTKFDAPYSEATDLQGINNRGEIVGSYVGLKGITRQFLYSNGVFITISPENYGYAGSIFRAINDEGQIVAGRGDATVLLTPSYFTGF